MRRETRRWRRAPPTLLDLHALREARNLLQASEARSWDRVRRLEEAIPRSMRDWRALVALWAAGQPIPPEIQELLTVEREARAWSRKAHRAFERAERAKRLMDARLGEIAPRRAAHLLGYPRGNAPKTSWVWKPQG